MTLALNVADPLVAGGYGKAAFDAVGPLLLIGWAEVGPSFMQAIGTTTPQAQTSDTEHEVQARTPTPENREDSASLHDTWTSAQVRHQTARAPGQSHPAGIPSELLERARQEDAAHRATHQRPISADSLRKRLGVGAKRARRLVALVRSEAQMHASAEQVKDEVGSNDSRAATTLAT